MKFSYKLALFIFLATLAWLASGQFSRTTKETGEKKKAPKTVSVQVRKSTASPIQSEIVVQGLTAPRRQVTLKSRTSGTVATTPADEGDLLSQGTLLVELHADDRPEKKKQAEALLEQRELEYEAARDLSERGYNPRIKLAGATTALNEARAGLAAIKLDIAHTEIRMPFRAVLEERLVEESDMVAPGTPVARIVEIDPLRLVAQISESRISGVEMGSVAAAELMDGTKLDGVVTTIGKAADPATRTYRVEMETPNPDGAIPAGRTLEVRLPAGKVRTHRISPAILSLDSEGRVGIKTVDGENIVHFHPVQIIKQNAEGMWISGLPRTATIITVGQEFAATGSEVKPRPQKETMGSDFR